VSQVARGHDPRRQVGRSKEQRVCAVGGVNARTCMHGEVRCLPCDDDEAQEPGGRRQCA
jgi:hypothetical protein